MSHLTRCPNCATTFRVSDAQLALRGGRVRCGHCSFVFNARACQVDADPVTIVDLSSDPAMQEHDPFWDPPLAAAPAPEPEPAPVPDPVLPEPDIQWPEVDALQPEPEDTPDGHDHDPWVAQLQELPAPGWLKAASAVEDETPAVNEEFVPLARLDAGDEPVRDPVARNPAAVLFEPGAGVNWLQPARLSPWRWVWRLASLCALLTALMLLALLLRQPLIKWYPPSRPLLATSCMHLGCELHAPRNLSLLFLDGIEFSFDPTDPQRLELNAVLRNTAPYSQAWPIIDVQLLDLQGRRVARRLLKPAQYLPPAQILQAEFPAEHEVQLTVSLQLNGLVVENYSVGFQPEF